MQTSANSLCNLVSGGNIQFDLLGSELKMVAEQSNFFSHPLGFFRMRIGTLSGGPIYLHVWLPDESQIQVPRLTIHAHSVTIASFIIMGAIEDYRYTWTDDDTGSQRLFAQDRISGARPLVRTNRVGFTSLVSSRRFCAMDRYVVPYPEFHESRVRTSSLTATICNFVGESNNDPLVVAPVDWDQAAEYNVVVLEETKKFEVIRRVLDAIDKIGLP